MGLDELFVIFVWGGVFLFFILALFRSVKIVPQRYTIIVERLGKYHMTLHSGFHVLIPFVDKETYFLDLKEESIDVPPQECFTKDEIKVNVDGVMYISVVDPTKAAYGVTNYKWAAMQLAQTTTRSVIGKLTLDKTFEEREYISAAVVKVLDQTSQEWGLRVHRYEIKNIQPPKSVQYSMEKQVTAERERSAILAKSSGDKQSRINKSEGVRLEMINNSEGERQKRINEAMGVAEEIRKIADATAFSLEKIANAIAGPNGDAAVKLQLSEQLIRQYAKIAKEETQVVVSLDVTQLKSLLLSVDL